jgi:preprotein translocase subunit SecG
MKTVLIIICILLIALVLLQAGKVSDGDIFTGSNSELYKNRKERGGELFITRLTFFLGCAYFIICMIQGF